MAAQKGRSVLIGVENTPGAGAYTTVGGMRAKQFSINNGEVDLSDSDSDWAQVGIGFALKSVRISGNGIYKNTAQQRAIINAVLNSATLNYQMTCPGLGTFTGAFVVGAVDIGGQHDSELSFSCNFTSTGEVVYAAAA